MLSRWEGIMSEAGFTKGPWEINRDGVSLAIPLGPCRVTATYCGSKANAHLIAAAPDLYEALSRMVKIYDGMEDCMGDPCPAVEHSKTILARARGEAQ